MAEVVEVEEIDEEPASITSPLPLPRKEPETSKRDRRRAKEARKKTDVKPMPVKGSEAEIQGGNKVEEEPVTEKARPNRTNGFQAVKKGRSKMAEEPVTEERITQVLAGVREKQAKLADKWSGHWQGEPSESPELI